MGEADTEVAANAAREIATKTAYNNWRGARRPWWRPKRASISWGGLSQNPSRTRKVHSATNSEAAASLESFKEHVQKQIKKKRQMYQAAMSALA